MVAEDAAWAGGAHRAARPRPSSWVPVQPTGDYRQFLALTGTRDACARATSRWHRGQRGPARAVSRTPTLSPSKPRGTRLSRHTAGNTRRCDHPEQKETTEAASHHHFTSSPHGDTRRTTTGDADDDSNCRSPLQARDKKVAYRDIQDRVRSA